MLKERVLLRRKIIGAEMLLVETESQTRERSSFSHEFFSETASLLFKVCAHSESPATVQHLLTSQVCCAVLALTEYMGHSIPGGNRISLWLDVFIGHLEYRGESLLIPRVSTITRNL